MLFERRLRGLKAFRDNYALKQYVHATLDHEPRNFLFCVDPTFPPVTVLIRQRDGEGSPVRMPSRPGQEFIFSLRVSTYQRNGFDTKIPTPVDGLIPWLVKRSEPNGFELVGSPIVADHRRTSLRRKDHSVPLNDTTYAGRLRVTSVERLSEVMEFGFPNHHKAFGFGLLQLF